MFILLINIHCRRPRIISKETVMRKKLVFLLIPISLCLLIGGYHFYKNTPTATVAIIPLDSRPCNTQYPQTLGEMADMQILLPPAELLDDYLTASNKDALWQWLEKTSAKTDHIIICTNQLFQGGLINSRNSDSLADISTDLARLENFCQNTDQTITVLAILPRLLPSQYDSTLSPYTNELKAYGIAWDKALLNNTPLPESTVPTAVLDKYRSLFLQNEQMIEQLESLANKGYFNLVIGQDDASEYCPSNIIKRHILARDSAQVTFIHGADELTMLILASYLDLPPLEANIIIDDSEALNTYFPYEADTLSAILSEKLAFAQITPNEQATDSIFIHTRAQEPDLVDAYLSGSHAGYVAIADIATTNRGDAALADTLLKSENFAQIHCYSGWNTCSNTLGTVLAHYRFSQAFSGSTKATQAALRFKAIRFNEDLIYQALLAPSLNQTLVQKGLIDPSTTAFKVAASEIEPYLTDAYTPYSEKLLSLFLTPQEILPNYSVTVTNATFALCYPWARTFEVCADSTFNLQ